MKPDNILFGAGGKLVIADFGVSKLVLKRKWVGKGNLVLESKGKCRDGDQVLLGALSGARKSGTPEYMAPESFKGY